MKVILYKNYNFDYKFNNDIYKTRYRINKINNFKLKDLYIVYEEPKNEEEEVIEEKIEIKKPVFLISKEFGL